MAHRHKMQARARGGRAEFAKGGGLHPGAEGGGFYSGEKGNVDNEARKKKTGPFAKGGGVAVGKAFGGAVKGRADKRKRGGAVSKGFAFASGGKVWSGARSGIAGEKGMAQAVMTPSKLHGEMHDSTVKTANDGANYRSGHGDKAKHQYKDGGRVALKTGGRTGYQDGGSTDRGPLGKYSKSEEYSEPPRDGQARGGRQKKAGGGECEKKKDGGDDDEDDPGNYKRGGKLQMHYVGGKGKRHRRQTGGPALNESGDADEGE